MRFDRWRTFLTAVLLSMTAAASGAGCLCTGFGLEAPAFEFLCGLWLLAAVICTVGFSHRRGRLWIYCTAAFLLGCFWHRREAGNQCLSLVYRLAEAYDRAYRWGVPQLPAAFERRDVFDYPVGIWGGLAIMGVCRWVCTRRRSPFLLGWIVLPLALCLVVTDTVPGELPLFTLLAVLAVLLLTESVRLESISQSSRLVWMAAIPVTAACFLLFWLNPKESYVNKTEPIQAYFSEFAGRLHDIPISLSIPKRDRVDLSALEGQEKKGIPIMEVTSRRGGPVYLRGQAYERYSGTGWEAGQGQESFCGGEKVVDTIDIHTRTSLNLLYLPYFPETGTVLTDGHLENTDRLNRYTQNVTEPEVQSPPSERCLALPPETAERLASLPIPYSASKNPAEAILNYVNQSARYDRTKGRMPANQTDFALWFLTESETGYCVHFASAAAVLLRSAGIPARYVTGYLVDTKPGEPTIVTTDHAHAWAEYYDEAARRWRILDATPAEDCTPAPEKTKVLDEKPEVKRFPQVPLYWLAVLPGLCALVCIRRFSRLALRRWKRNRQTPTQRALTLWQEAQQLSALAGEAVPEELEAIVQKASFSRRGLTEEELLPFQNYAQQMRRILQSRNWFKRMVYWGVECVI